MLIILKIKVISYTIFYFFLLPYVYFLKLFKDDKYIKTYGHNLAEKWGVNIIKWSNTNVKLIGAENLPDHPVVIVSNHQAHFDIMLLFGFTGLSPSFIAKNCSLRITFLLPVKVQKTLPNGAASSIGITKKPS